MEINVKAKRKVLIFLAVAEAVLWVPVINLLMNNPPGFIQDLGFLSGPGGTLLAWILALLVALVYSAFTVCNNPLVREYWRTLSLLKLFAVTVTTAAAIVEEAFFRRLIIDWVLTAGGGVFLQILASGFIFGLAHGIWGIVTGRFFVGIGVIIATGSLGIALGIVYGIGDRSLASVIVSHFLITVTIQPELCLRRLVDKCPALKKIDGA